MVVNIWLFYKLVFILLRFRLGGVLMIWMQGYDCYSLVSFRIVIFIIENILFLECRKLVFFVFQYGNQESFVEDLVVR